MKVWLLRPHSEDLPPWMPWQDKLFGLVLTSFDEASARKLAAANAEYEAVGWPNPWLDPEFTSCVEVGAGDEEIIVMRDFEAAP